jgi:hypothetical protein
MTAPRGVRWRKQRCESECRVSPPVWRFGALAHTGICGISGQHPAPEPAKRHAFNASIFGAAIAGRYYGPTIEGTPRSKEGGKFRHALVTLFFFA